MEVIPKLLNLRLLKQRGYAYLAYLLRAQTKYDVHSPFVYNFVTQALPHKTSEKGRQIEAFRKVLSKSKITVHYREFGALGSENGFPRKTTLGKIVRRGACRHKTGELLRRICALYQPQNCLELGTHLGFSALYQLNGLNRNAQFTTVDASEDLQGYAKKFFLRFGFSPKIINARFEDFLASPKFCAPLEYIFLDGNHTYAATLSYVRALLPYCKPGAILVIDDIYWSEPMQKAWQELIHWPEITISLDLYRLGILIVNRPQAKENFVLRF
jgi:predicted O-methyltransferase YrrM